MIHTASTRTVAGFALLLMASCFTPTGAPNVVVIASIQPTLEEVFLLPGMHGGEPRVRSVSADGRVCLVEWRAIVRAANGRFEWGEDRSPHLVPTSGGPHVLDEHSSMLALLERCERALHAAQRPGVTPKLEGWHPTRPNATAWSRRGGRLALAWDHGVVLLDPMLALESNSTQGYEVLLSSEARNEVAPELTANGAEVQETPREKRSRNISSLEFTEDDSGLVVREDGELYLFPLDTEQRPLGFEDAVCITERLEASARDGELSRDHRTFFSRDKVLGKITRTHDDGTTVELDAHVEHLETQEKVHLEQFDEIEAKESVDLSPDGRFVVGFEVDRTSRPEPTIVPNYLTDRVSTIESRRELADDVTSPRKMWMWSTADGSRRAIEFPDADSFSIQTLGWAPKGETRLLLRRTSLDYRIVETWLWDESGPSRLVAECDERWVGGPGSFTRWSKDGTRVLFASECCSSSSTPGRNQLFEIEAASGAVRQLTEVEGEVWSFTEREDGMLAFTAIRDDPSQREIGVIREGRVTWLDVPRGMNTNVILPAETNSAVFLHAELGVPEDIFIADLDARVPCVRVTQTTPADFASRAWIRPVKLQATHSDGTRIYSHVYLPRATSLASPDRARPCVMFIHGAGYLQNVTDSMSEYAVNMLFHSRLAEMGYVVADVDYRGSAGYGSRFRTDVQNQLGKLELEDIGAIVDELARLGVVDDKRVACYGGSYGGFLTLMALFTEPDRWVGGAALRSVTDWRTYHPGYTQPRLGRPSQNEEAYKRSSPIDLAENLRDPLLILHGMIDTNVFAQDSVRLIEKLIDLGLDFDAMLYPSQGHAFTDGMHWLDEYKRIERFMVEHLGVP